jgi:dCMP deaminase
MSDRISKIEMMVAIAHVVKLRSTCQRAQVGCVITDTDYTTVVSMGYNGNYRGGPDGCDRPKEQGNCGCVHAEANALVKAPYDTGKLALITTTAPCPMCAKMIVNSRVRMVVYDTSYRDAAGIMLLRHAGVDLHPLDQAGRRAIYEAAVDVMEDMQPVVERRTMFGPTETGRMRMAPNFLEQSEAAHKMMADPTMRPPHRSFSVTDHTYVPHLSEAGACGACPHHKDDHLLR